ncbi:hypothetical protein [Sporosarcina sp. G11-34]|uniref:hypothetical protein n=1 Tax=Sporosarcina sp. G11-34 TaxID=2849605 RepID=UPI0022A94B73|nr:hypothetical protein [Sporosarcina sp. G11-34]MCZ2257588.1 hypothetical protein [Sporosarcina sp. G11-34]
MSDKKFTLTIVILFVVLTSSVVSFNFWIDPLWHYSHAHAYNDVQKVINEREQKVAQLQFEEKDYDTLLIGSSRATYIHPSAFDDWKVFNASVANLSMREYYSYLLYAKSQNKHIERVILGVDFFKSSEQEASGARSLDNYEKKVNQPFYRSKNLLSLQVLDYSIDNFNLSRKNSISEDRLYNRKGEAFAKKLSKDEIEKMTSSKIERFKKTFYGERYTYYSQYAEIMAKVKDVMPDGATIVFTTPISTELFKALVDTGLYDDYEVWLRDLVNVYGGVWNFMYPNSVTNDIRNYYDGHHFYPETGDLIANRIKNGLASTSPSDFGVYVTSDNIEAHLQEVRSLVAELK